MGKQVPDPAGSDQPLVNKAALHVASGVDATEATERAEQLAEILNRADARDQAAERRDRAAEAGRTVSPDRASTDRDWAGRDRDSAAEDRADLIELLQAQQQPARGDEGDHLSR